MLKGLDANERDIIEEICVAYFAERKADKDPSKVIIKEKKFKQWWSEGKLDNYEIIKFYIIDWVIKQLQEKGVDEIHQERYKSYIDKNKEIRILKEHYENNFTFTITPPIQGPATKEEVKGGKEEQKKGVFAAQLGQGAVKGFGLNIGGKVPSTIG